MMMKLFFKKGVVVAQQTRFVDHCSLDDTVYHVDERIAKSVLALHAKHFAFASCPIGYRSLSPLLSHLAISLRI